LPKRLSGGVSKLAATLKGSPINGNHHDGHEAHEAREDILVACFVSFVVFEIIVMSRRP
jgi:hypothetical protein